MNATTLTRQAPRLLYWALVLVLAAYVLLHFLLVSGVNSLQPASIDRVLAGTAAKPYTYRVLVPLLATTLAPAIDTDAAFGTGLRLETILGNRFFRRDLDGKRHASEVLLILGMMYASLIGFAVGMWLLLGALGYAAAVRLAVPPLLLLGTALFMRFGYIYDFTTLFLFTLGCLLIHKQTWIGYLIVFACATLNKETAVFLGLIFVVSTVRRLPRPHFLWLALLQAAIYVVLQGAIRYHFRANPGADLLNNLALQVQAFHYAATFAPWMLIAVLLAVLAAGALITHRLGAKPLILRSALAVLPFFVVLYFVGGYPGEIRVFLELYPALAVLMLPPPSP